MQTLLNSLNACQEAKDWAENKTWKEVYETCPRGDWLLWLFKKVNPDDLQLLTLAKGHCANTIRYLMKDSRSIKAVDSAILFGENKITKEELKAAYDAAYAAYAAADTADAAAYAAYVAAYAANAANAAAYAADAADTANAAYAAARKKMELTLIEKAVSILNKKG